MNNNIIEIKNLSCSYSQKREEKVLQIDDLSFEKGKVIFLLGASGSGKSTLLETLGLMNNTIASGNVNLILENDEKVDFAKLWNDVNENEITKIRKNFLSFIFQNTNLMESFTAYENICLSQMIKSESSLSDTLDGAVNLMAQVGLPETEVDFEKLSVNLSGGQRQRVSFVRALNTDFKVLLCDEPTGNLDEKNAHELLKIVKENLHNDRTAIIVSHDINLALKYADKIVVITKNHEKKYGEVKSENIFYRNNWENLDNEFYAKFRNTLLSFFASDSSETTNRSELKVERKKSVNNSYKKLFLTKEANILYGKSKVNLAILVSIVSLTLISLGFANGALKYLDSKLNDPFVNWLTVGLPWAKSNASIVEEITEKLNNNDVRKRFLIDTVTSYKETPLPFFNNNSLEYEFIKGRLISSSDPIMYTIMNPDNKISGDSTFKDDRDLGIIVTSAMLSSLNYPNNAKVIYLDNSDIDSLSGKPLKFRVPIPIRAVVKEIPGKNKYLINEFFYQAFVNQEFSVFDFKEQTKRILFYVDDKQLAIDFAKSIRKLVPSFELNKLQTIASERYAVADDSEEKNETESSSDDDDSNDSFFGDDEETTTDSKNENVDDPSEKVIEELTIDINAENKSESVDGKGADVSIQFSSKPSFFVTESVYNKIVKSEFYKTNKNKILRVFDYDLAEDPVNEIHNDYLCINFKKNGLDSIESFSKYIFSNLNEENAKGEANIISVDSGSVKEKKNFNYISKTTLLIALLLVVFSILAISLFISNLLKNHLNKVKMNLGTFKAFGLSNQQSVKIYMQIMMRFIFIGIFISLIIASLIGSLVEVFFGKWLNIEDQSDYFKLLDTNTFILIAIIIFVSAYVSNINIKRILSKTPGDLIYNR